MLVISSDTFPVYAQHREVWRTYMSSHPDIDCYFIHYSPFTWVPSLTNDTLTLRGNERYAAILSKTLDALRELLPRKPYTHVVRTNLSSVWNFAELCTYLSTQPVQRFYGGIALDNGGASGAGILLSRDVAEFLCRRRRDVLSIGPIDDEAIGTFLQGVGIPLTIARRVDFVSLAHYEADRSRIPAGTFHYRVKHAYPTHRGEEPEMMRRILHEQIR
jgi:hypothetical protein